MLLEKFNQPFDFGDGDRMTFNHLALLTVVLTVDGDHHVNVFLFDQLIDLLAETRCARPVAIPGTMPRSLSLRMAV